MSASLDITEIGQNKWRVSAISFHFLSPSVGRVGPGSILSRVWVGRSENFDQNSLKPPKNNHSDPTFLRRAPASAQRVAVGRSA